VSLLILISPLPVPHRILILLRTRAKAIILRPTKRNLLPIHLRINLPTKATARINPTAVAINPISPHTALHTSPHTHLRTSRHTALRPGLHPIPITNNLPGLTAVLHTLRDLRLRIHPIVGPPPHTNPPALLLPLTDPHLHPDLPLTVDRHLLIDPQGAVLLPGVRREVLPPGLPGLAPRRALSRKKVSKSIHVKQFKNIKKLEKTQIKGDDIVRDDDVAPFFIIDPGQTSSVFTRKS